MATVTQTGPRSWRVEVRRKGHPRVCRTFRSEREAKAFAKSAEAEIARGGSVSRGALTIARAVEVFRELRETGKRPVRLGTTEEYMLRHLSDAEGIGNIEVDRLTPQKLAEWARTRHDDGAGPYTVSMEVSKLGTVLKYAAVSLHTVLPDVVGAARPLLEYQGLIGPGKSRERRPTAEEFAAVLAHLSPTMQDIARFAVASAMRRGEICRITWVDVDESRRCILVRDRKHPKSKQGNHQVIPLTDHTGLDAWAIMQRQPRISERIFPVTTESISDEWQAARETAGVVDLHFHDLRHEATSRLFEAGLSIEQVAVITGHKNWSNLRRYTHVRPESLHAVGTRPGTVQHPGNPPT